MAVIDFPSNPTNAQEVTEGNVTYVYNATKGYWESSEGSSGASITVYADMTALIAATGMSNGDQAFVTANNNLYLYSGSGWYKIATVQNDSPSAITGVDGSYSLAIDGTPTVITAVSTDPEGFPLTWSYATSGLGSIATVSQVDNVFTITPSTDDANFGTFTLTINATDGVNGAVSANTSITLQFYITNSQYTTLLATAVNTSTNNVITDGSTNIHTVTVNGNSTTGTFSPYNDSYSASMDGGDLYYLSSSADWNLGSNWTIEGWFYPTAQPTETCRIFMFGTNGGSAAMGIGLNSDMTWGGGGAFPNGAMFNLPQGYLNQWQHVAWVRDGSSNTGTIYVNGVATAGSYSGPAVQAAGNVDLKIGYDTVGTVAYQYRGYFADIRITKSAVYTTNFTPPTERLTSSDVLTDTKLLAFNKPYLEDQSTSNHNISISAGNPRFKVFAPFERLEYLSSNNGGSVYFDGSGDNLTVANSTALQLGTTSAFTAEFWVYIPATNADYSVLLGKGYNTGTAEWYLELMADGAIDIFLSNNGTNYTYLTTSVTGVLQQNTWHHIAFVRENTSTIKVYTNGTQSYSNTSVSDWNVDTGPVNIGGYNDGGTALWSNTYITDVRIVKGTALYTSDFTPPAAPLTAITNTSLLVSGTDASIIDKSQSSNPKLIGNATGSTTQVKFADTKSIYLDSSVNAVSFTPGYDDPLFNFGTGDWTIELWAYIQTLSSGRNLVSFLRAGTNEAVPHFYTQDTGLRYYVNNTDVITSTNVLTLNTWHHIALTRNGNDHKIFVDGTQVGNTWTSAQTYVQGRPVLGDYHASLNNLNGAANTLHGYVQDFRITKGLARYTANFTPPAEPLKG